MNDPALVEVRRLSHCFQPMPGMRIQAVNDVSFSIRRGEIFGLVGESGSGKSTIARCMINALQPIAGKIIYGGVDTCDPKQFKANKKRLQRCRQFVFQDSGSALNPRMTVRQILEEPLRIHGLHPDRAEREAFLKWHLGYVGIEPYLLDRHPNELSGGQRQRIGIARALVMDPELMIADEPIASLDVSIQAQIVNLFKHLQAEHGFTFLFIAHDLAMVEFLCDRVGVLYRGHLVEMARTRDLYRQPLHPYTQSLLSALPVPDPRIERARRHRPVAELDLSCAHSFREVAEEHYVRMEG